MGWASDGFINEETYTWSCNICDKQYDLDHWSDIEMHALNHYNKPKSNGRISRDEMLMQIAHVVSMRGTCSRLHVGAVFSRDGRIISTGYNGTPRGMPHCEHWDDEPHSGCDQAEHAERNAIAYAARFGVALDSSEAHITHAPCLSCARTLINAGILRVVYQVPYRLTEGIELLEAVGIQVIDFRTEA